MLFSECIYLYLENFMGKGIFCLDCWGQNPLSVLFLKIKYVIYIY